MSEIKRYYLQDGKQDGEPTWFVSADDHLAAIEQAKIDAVRELAERQLTVYDKLLSIANMHTLHDGYQLSQRQVHIINYLYNAGLFDKQEIHRLYNEQMAD